MKLSRGVERLEKEDHIYTAHQFAISATMDTKVGIILLLQLTSSIGKYEVYGLI